MRLFSENNRPGAVPVFPGVCETVEEMHRRGLLLTIASSRFRGSLMGFLDDMNLRGYIPYVVSVNDVEHPKPAPDMVLKTLADNALRPDEAVVVGDTVFDIQMAHNAGVRAVGVTYGNGSRSELEAAGAEYVIDEFTQVMRIIE